MKNLCKKYGKRVKAFALAVVMVVSLLPMVAGPEVVKAEITEDFTVENVPENVYVGTAKILNAGQLDEEALASFNGTVSYDVATATLTLNGANISGVHDDFRNNQIRVISSDGDLRIHVMGASTVSFLGKAPGSTSFGIYSEGKLALTGEKGKTLSVNGDSKEVDHDYLYAVKSEELLTIQADVSVNLVNNESDYDYAYGFECNSGCKITDAKVSINISGVEVGLGAGIKSTASGGLKVKNSELNVNTPNVNALHITCNADDGDIVFEDSTVNIYSECTAILSGSQDVNFINSDITLTSTDGKGTAVSALPNGNGTGYLNMDTKSELNISGFGTGLVLRHINVKGGKIDIDVAGSGIVLQSSRDYTHYYDVREISGGIINIKAANAIVLYGVNQTAMTFTISGGAVTTEGDCGIRIRYSEVNTAAEKNIVKVTGGTVLISAKENHSVFIERQFGTAPEPTDANFCLDVSNYEQLILEAGDSITGLEDITETYSSNNKWYEKNAIKITGVPRITKHPENVELIDGNTSTDLVVGTNFELTATYQWYKCDDADKTNPVAIEGATSGIYETQENLEIGTHYYYCVVTDSESGIDYVSNVANIVVKAIPYVVINEDASLSKISDDYYEVNVDAPHDENYYWTYVGVNKEDGKTVEEAIADAKAEYGKKIIGEYIINDYEWVSYEYDYDSDSVDCYYIEEELSDYDYVVLFKVEEVYIPAPPDDPWNYSYEYYVHEAAVVEIPTEQSDIPVLQSGTVIVNYSNTLGSTDIFNISNYNSSKWAENHSGDFSFSGTLTNGQMVSGTVNVRLNQWLYRDDVDSEWSTDLPTRVNPYVQMHGEKVGIRFTIQLDKGYFAKDDSAASCEALKNMFLTSAYGMVVDSVVSIGYYNRPYDEITLIVSVTEAPYYVHEFEAPVFTVQPQGSTIGAGDKITFSATASDVVDGNYQWQVKKTADGEFEDIFGAIHPTYTTDELTLDANGYQYRCIATNIKGSATSEVATLTVEERAPEITGEPEDATVTVGDKVTFTVTVKGNVTSYQWQVKKTADGEFEDIEGATSDTYTTDELTKESNGYVYRCIVTNNVGNDTSDPATLTVKDIAPVITEPSENTDATVKVGGEVTFEVEVVGENLEFQWQVDKGNGFENIENATGSTYTANKFDKCGDVYKYRCVVSNDGGEAESAVFTVTVKHTLKEVKANGATCTATGNNLYFECEVEGCGACFKDAEGKTATTVEAETIKMLDHDWATEWSKDGANHWHKCNDCTATNDVTPHADTDKDNVCDACKTVLHTHKLVEVPGVPATCDKPGNNKYYKCEVEGCGAFFKDAEGKTPTTEAAEVIAATGHADLNKDEVCDSCKTDLHEHVLTKVPAADATCTAAGNKEHYKCNCGKLFADAEGKTATTLEAVTIAPTAHADKDGDMVCDECKTELHKHVLVKVPGVAATCTTPGTKEYYKCTAENCTELFADAEGKTATTLEATKIAALGHDWSGEWDVTKEATATEEGKKETLCERDCGQKKVVNIPKTGETDENGNVDKDAEVEAEAPIKEATLDNSKSELIGAGNIFTKEDKEAIERGEDARVWIEITKTDETTIKDKDKAKMEEEAADLVGEDATLTYFDVDLFKQVGNGKKEDISKPGVAIKITIAIPEELLNRDETIDREYKIIRLHTEGDVSEVDVISGEFNAETGEFSFETDRFSTYAITYADSPVVPDTPEVPDTGDTTSAMPIIMLVIGLGMVVAGLRRKAN